MWRAETSYMCLVSSAFRRMRKLDFLFNCSVLDEIAFWSRFPHVVLLLNLVVDLWYLGHENLRSSQGRSISCSATYTKLPSFYASILSFYANTNTCQWWKQFCLQHPFVMNMFSGHFGFSSDKDDRLDDFGWLWMTSVRVIQHFQKSPSSRGRADVPGYTLKWAYYHVPTRRKGFGGW